MRRLHIDDRKYLRPFQQLLASIHDPRAILFVRYKAAHNPHVTLVRNAASLSTERIWVVYDRGHRENARLLAAAPDRATYLFDEFQGKTYIYDPRAQP